MATFRVNKTADYTVMSNRHLREKEMTLKAKGLLSLMLSLPETWDYSINGLCAICTENEAAIKSTLKELKQFGYLTIEKKMPNETESGRIEYIYNIYEQPHLNQPIEKQEVEKQEVENQPLEFQPIENPTQLSIDKSITKESNKNKSNTEDYKIIVLYLNEKAHTNFRPSSRATQQHIHARLQEGYTVEDFKRVIDRKCAEWMGTEFQQYLRPATLFGTKFENYLNAPASRRKTYGANGVEIRKPDDDDLAGIL